MDVFTPPCTSSLKEIAADCETSLFSVVLATFQVLLHRYSDQDDILVGTPKAGRTLKTARLMGYFVNPVVLRANLSGNPSFVAFLQQVHQTVEDSFAHDAYPFQKLIEDFQPTHALNANPFFQVAFAWQKTIKLGDRRVMASGAVGNAGARMQFKGFDVEPIPLAERVSPLDLTLLVGDAGDELIVTFEYKRDLFEPDTIARMAGHFQTLLVSIVADPGQSVATLPLLTEAELRQILVDWNDTAVPLPDLCFHQLFEQQVERTPEAMAVIFEGESLTYVQLNRRANQLAHHLRTLGIGPEKLGGIFLERSQEMVVALMGILKSGGAYLPLDPAYPLERLSFVVADAQPDVLLTQQTMLAHLPVDVQEGGPIILCLDSDWDIIAQQGDHNPLDQSALDNLAYIMYTSGSTGKPKGVQIEHRNVVNFLVSMQQEPGITPDDILYSVTTLSFDISVLELFLPLISGAQVVIADALTAADGREIIKALRRHQATILQATPSTWSMLVDADWQGTPSSRQGFCGGETLSRKLANAVLERNIVLWNMYGPTETTVWSSVRQVHPGSGRVPIGHPIGNTSFYILDKYGSPVPIGVAGELYIGGDGVARGYLNRPGLTTERFVTLPLGQDNALRLYKTGDLARYLPDGNVAYMGRVDSQVKIRGFRVELGEIEAALGQHLGIRATAVTAHTENASYKRLVAYLVPHEEPAPTTVELRQFLQQKLPHYMIPSAFVILTEMPLSPNGKVDRRALPAPDGLASDLIETYIAPGTRQEKILADVWEQVLQVERVGLHDNFFELGGHSLLATQIISRIREVNQIDLPVRAIFEAPTIVELAKRIVALQAEGSRVPSMPLVPVERTGYLPLSFSQERMWFLHQFDPGSAAYNIPGLVRLSGPLDKEALEWSINHIIDRHESLRTRFMTVNGQPSVIIDPAFTFTLPVKDCRMVTESEREAYTIRLVEADARIPFRLDQLPLFQIKLFQLDDEEQMLLVNMHHIISDQWSSGVLSRELIACYRVYGANRSADLPKMPIQAVDHAVWQRRLAVAGVFDVQMAYWKKQLDAMTALDLPSDRPRPAVQTTNGAILTFPLPPGLTDLLQKLSQRESVSPFMILLAAFKLLLFRYTGVKDIAVGSPIANRRQLPSEALISSLVNTLVLRTDLSGDPTFRQLLQRVRNMTLDAYAHQDIPFEKLVQELRSDRDTSRSPLFQLFFNVQNAPFTLPDFSQVEVEPLMIDRGAAQFDLSLSVDAEVMHLAWLEYNTDLFDADRMERLMGHYWTLLKTAVADPDRYLSDLPLLTKAETQQLVAWNDTAVPYQRDACLHHLFEAQVERTPQKTAVTFQKQALTYRQLNQRANQLALHLRNLGVAPGSLVAINLERSLAMIVALFAVHKAGAAYLPLDPAFPQERLDFMLADSEAGVLITQSSLRLAQSEETALQIVCVDGDTAVIDQYDNHNLPHSAMATNLAYIIYTSGSTGKPKGVQIEHRSVVNFLQAMRHEPGMTADDTMLAVTTLSFDIAVLEIFLPLILGARLVLADWATTVDGPRLLAKLTACGATIMQATPTTWRMLLESGWEEKLPLKGLCGGEALPFDLAQALLPRCTSLWNMYGPTEATVWSSVLSVTPQMTRISIGPPIANTQFYVLDTALQLAPVGVVGELYIGGDGLARGYWNRPEEMAVRFLEHTWSNGETVGLYKTGDLVRYLPDGQMEFLGRNDHQVKIRGFRIELGDIEAALTRHTAVRAATVMVRKFGAGDQRLIAYIIANNPESVPTAQQLRRHLRQILPDYMIPAIFVSLAEFPLMPNKKVDRRAFPAPRWETGDDSDAKPIYRNDIEQKLARMWEDLLQVRPVSATDDFFHLGGHSLLALRLFARIEEEFGVNIPLVELFQEATARHLADLVREDLGVTVWDSLVAIQTAADETKRPFFCVHGLTGDISWFIGLARHMGEDVPFYGLQSRGLDGVQEPLLTIEAMAAHYVSELRSVQPEGPYLLGGYSYGAHVAYEMACLLQEQDEAIALLAVLDTFALLKQGEIPLWQQILRNGAMRLDRSLALVKLGPKKIGNRIRRLLNTWRRQIKRRLSPTAPDNPQYEAADLIGNAEQFPLHVQRVITMNFEAMDAYLPQGYRGDITIFQSSERPFSTRINPLMGWEQLTTGQVEIVTVPGSHTLMFREPLVVDLALKLRDIIGDAAAFTVTDNAE